MSSSIYSALLTAAMLTVSLPASVEKQSESCPFSSVQGEDSLSLLSLLQTRMQLEPDDSPKLLDKDLVVMYSDWLRCAQNPEAQTCSQQLGIENTTIKSAFSYSAMLDRYEKAREFAIMSRNQSSITMAPFLPLDPLGDVENARVPIGSVDTDPNWRFVKAGEDCNDGYTQAYTSDKCRSAVAEMEARHTKYLSDDGVSHEFSYDASNDNNGDLCFCNDYAVCSMHSSFQSTGLRMCQKRAVCDSYNGCTGAEPYKWNKNTMCTGNESTCDSEACCGVVPLTPICSFCARALITVIAMTRYKIVHELCNVFIEPQRFMGITKYMKMPFCAECYPHIEVLCRGEVLGGEGSPGGINIKGGRHKTSVK